MPCCWPVWACWVLLPASVAPEPKLLLCVLAAMAAFSAHSANSLNLSNYALTGSHALDSFNGVGGRVSGLEVSRTGQSFNARDRNTIACMKKKD